MNSNWIRTAFKYGILVAPSVFLLGLVVMVGLGAWVTSILREPAFFSQAPILVQKMTRAVYWHTRTHWHTIPQCVMFDQELLYRPRPGSCEFRNAEFRTVMHFDESGARRLPEPPPTADAAPKPRLVILGDSHAMGWGVEDSETFASRLAAEHGYATVNLAVSSYATTRELLRLERDFPLRPDDVIVIQYCDNDFEENLSFSASGRVGPYEPEELDALFAYQPTRVATLSVAGKLMRLLASDLIDRLPRLFGIAHSLEGVRDTTLNPSEAFLRVLSSHPELRRHRVIVVAINGPRLGTHLSSTQLAAAGIPLVVPTLDQEDFFAIDDHMRARGHQAVAALIAGSL
jgi:hypothetical protein